MGLCEARSLAKHNMASGRPRSSSEAAATAAVSSAPIGVFVVDEGAETALNSDAPVGPGANQAETSGFGVATDRRPNGGRRAPSLLRRQFQTIPASDRVFLSTWEKWLVYGRIPWKLLLHVILLILTTWQIVHINVRDAAYVRAAKRNFYYYFFPSDFDFEDRQFYLYTVDEAHSSVERAVTSFVRITTTSVDQISHPANPAFCLTPDNCHHGRLEVLRFVDDDDDNTGEDIPVSENLNAAEEEEFDDMRLTHTTRETYYIHEGSLGPLSKDHGLRPEARVASYLRSVVNMNLVFRLQTEGPKNTGRECLIWEIRLFYDFQQRGQMVLTLQSAVAYNCAPRPTISSLLSRTIHLIDICVIFFSAWTLVLSIRSVYNSWLLLRRAERKIASEHSPTPRRRSRIMASVFQDASFTARHEGVDTPLLVAELGAYLDPSMQRQQEEDEVIGSRLRVTAPDSMPKIMRGTLRFSWRDRLRFFNAWFVLATTASILNILQSSIRLARTDGYTPLSTREKFFAGLGCGLVWINSVSFLAHRAQYFTLVLTLSRAIPRVGRYLLGVVPILLAYAFFGMIFFGDHVERFGSFSMSLITLYSVLNGDVIRETFMDVVNDYPVVTQLYLYSFISLFMYVVLNVFIAIVEESFFSTRAAAKNMETFTKQARGQNPRMNSLGSIGEDEGSTRAGEGATMRRRGQGSDAPRRFQSDGDLDTPLLEQDNLEEPEQHRKLQWLRTVLDDLED